MKTYRAVRGFRDNRSGAGEVKVFDYTDPDRPNERDLVHRVRHSPTGFAWGYGGSGPADLARSILWDHLGFEPAPGVYQAFKREFIEPLNQDGPFVINGSDIRDWLALNFPNKFQQQAVDYLAGAPE